MNQGRVRHRCHRPNPHLNLCNHLHHGRSRQSHLSNQAFQLDSGQELHLVNQSHLLHHCHHHRPQLHHGNHRNRGQQNYCD